MSSGAMFDAVHCPVCNEVFEDPRVLRCMHTVCIDCIKAKCKPPELECPLCGYVTPTGMAIEQLPKNVVVEASVRRWCGKKSCGNCGEHDAVWYCPRCSVPLCTPCNAKIHGIEIFKNHDVVKLHRVAIRALGSSGDENNSPLFDHDCVIDLPSNAANNSPTQRVQRKQSPLSPTTLSLANPEKLPVKAPAQLEPSCYRHSKAQLKFFCPTCKIPICEECVSDATHRGHGRMLPIAECASTCVEKLQSVLTPLLGLSQVLLEAVQLNRDVAARVVSHAASCQQLISDEIDALVQLLKERKAVLLSTVDEVKEGKLSMLQCQLDTLRRENFNLEHSVVVGASLLPFEDRRTTETRLVDSFSACGATPEDTCLKRALARSSDEFVFAPSTVASVACEAEEYLKYAKSLRVDTTPCVDAKIFATLQPGKDAIRALIANTGKVVGKLGELTFLFGDISESKGVLYYLGCARGSTRYANPFLSKHVEVCCSSLGYGRVENIVSLGRSQFCTQNLPEQWITVELECHVVLKHYAFHHDQLDESHFLRNWNLYGWSSGKDDWVLLSCHVIDETVSAQHPHGDWEVTVAKNEENSSPLATSKFKLVMTGPNSNANYYMMLSGLELYGTLFDE